MVQVAPERREEIANQLYARVDSLVDFFNSKYLDPIDAKRRSGFFRWLLRQTIGKPLTKTALKRAVRSVIKPYLLEHLPYQQQP